MNSLFQRILVSCPNGGGLFLAHDDSVFKLDNTDTAGLWSSNNMLLRGTQPASIWIHGIGQSSLTTVLNDVADVHDVIEWQGYFYAIGTTKNEVFKLGMDGQVVQRWEFPGEADSMHLNCLGVWNGRLCFSAFGDFRVHRGYKGMTREAGFVQDLESGERLISGLSQPHSLVESDGNLLIANSECLELREYSPTGECLRRQQLDGYTRGICKVGDVLYVGLSQSRNVSEAGIASATVVALNAESWAELGRITLAAREIYSIVRVESAAELIKSISMTVELSSQKRSEQLHAARTEVGEKNQLIVGLQAGLAEKDQLIVGLQAALAEKDHGLDLIKSERQADMAKIMASASWQLTKPVRLLGYLARGDWQSIQVGMANLSRSLGRVNRRLTRLFRAARYAVNHYGSLRLAVSKTLELYRKHGLAGLRERAAALMVRNGDFAEADQMSSAKADFYQQELEVRVDYQPLVSVIVPNYNHSSYLRERLDSIYAQTYSNFEVILLDDLSSDDSREILSEYERKYKANTRCVFNEVNSGGVFKQWKKGLELAVGELVWIAESDDYCSTNFIEENVRNFSNEAVMLSFARSVFVRGIPPRPCWSTEEYLSFLGADFWREPFTKSAHWLVNNGWSLKNIVPNVSSAMFRNPRGVALLDDQAWAELKVCGDWVFYLHLVRGGLVSYTPAATSFYRQHANNTSVRSQLTDTYYREYEYVASQMVSLYDVDEKMLERLRDDLRTQWVTCRTGVPTARLDELFDLARIKAHAQHRKPNLLIIVYALAAGGGETFPLMLAGLMRQNGYGVAVLNCNKEPAEPGVRAMLRSDIPLLELKQLDHAPLVMKDLGVEVIHSHHAWVDITFASLLQGYEKPAHVVSMHGMYEMMPDAQIRSILPLMERKFHQVVYTAEKNLAPFSGTFLADKSFTRIDNALPMHSIQSIDRAELGIEADSFVVCLVSRAIPEKGWQEAVAAIKDARARSERPIHLILIGEGPEYEILKAGAPIEGVHLLGFKKNIRDYFAMADLGLLPSRFKGESYPLVLIDCLHAGTPMLASDIGEIRSMLLVEGGMAGAVFSLNDWQIPVQQLADLIVKYAAVDSVQFVDMCVSVSAAGVKFDPEQMYKNYDAVYGKALHHGQHPGAERIVK